ncbi:TIGR01906 family membrane protein [Proteiniclasticum sp.]|uniref:TIGR01906 family membrane protein n=1 Tax=Proteiniclasticum sp. TaxID=2053595 RepID=UPI0028990CA2|nr:TIGR01906 family membrane protein [Proteiniclasticum sp.]
MKEYLYALINSLMIISGSVILGLNIRLLYYFNIPRIQALNEEYSGGLIRSNYDILIDYLNPFYRGKLQLDGLAMSPQGEFHFYEVKVIFDLIYILFAVTLILSLFIYMRQRRERELVYMKKAAILTFIIPVILGIPFIVDFSKAFVIFHEIAFSNDYWIFDPRIDPVIKILPEWFFMYAAFLILILMLLSAVLFYVIGSRSMRKSGKKS